MTQTQKTTTQITQPTDPTKQTDKTKYQITNWNEYNSSLVARGAVTFWLSSDVLDNWNKPVQSGKAGHPKSYSDVAIRASLTIQAVYHLPLRATEGFVQSLLFLLGCPHLKSPDYSTLSYRSSSIEVPMSSSVRHALASGEPLHIAIDSTGVKIYGEGEWKVRKHGWSKRRTWRKVHLGVDVSSNLIPAGTMTERDMADSYMVEPLIEQMTDQLQTMGVGGVRVAEILGDGAYDRSDLRDYCQDNNIKLTVPPRVGSISHHHPKSSPNYRSSQETRNRDVTDANTKGLAEWKKNSGYHKRSLSETAMFRFKTIFGSNLPSRDLKRQATQVAIRIQALNEMTLLGMPKSVLIT
jgi:Transposase DDE domain